MIPEDRHLNIGSIVFDGLDQIDFTGPFEVLARIPNSTFHLGAKTSSPVRDTRGLRIVPEKTFAEMPQLDVLHIPGGPGQEALMEDEETLSFIRTQAAGALYVFSVCTGALICGAAGLLVGKRATTHWAAMKVLPYLGAIPLNDRVVIEGNYIFAGGVTSGIDGALRLAAELRGDKVAQQIQLYMQYHPEPPFDAGTPERAPKDVLEVTREAVRGLTERRIETAKRVGQRLGVANPDIAA
ncbi:DJ-1/PfpI family protein [Rhizobium sp. BT-175]|uniref:DJ-1/PfpI family protein n=1 Tax=Rhizobium sp. BT-175 TaxID=2986929 RepID=UPI002235C730|nr:DJ-1/PfpI family protein [Rhizobium sp. BT-175]MCV9947591.1 DJ-1/PfpI family protein [Rhizobium sp. BT-175]